MRGTRSSHCPWLAALALGALATLVGACVRPYTPPIPSDYTRYRYSQHSYFRSAASSSTHRSGSYQITVTTFSHEHGQKRIVNIPDVMPPIDQANIDLLRANPQILQSPFRSVDGSDENTGSASRLRNPLGPPVAGRSDAGGGR